MPGTTEEALAVKILNASILEDTIPGIPGRELKFKDLEGRFLDVCLNTPSHQFIAKHSYFTLAAAASKGWIPLLASEYLALVAKIKDHSPEQDKIDRVKEWIRADSQGSATSRAQRHAHRAPYLTLRCSGELTPPSLDCSLAACSDAAPAAQAAPRGPG